MKTTVERVPVSTAHQACSDAISDVLMAHADTCTSVELFGILANACGWYSVVSEMSGFDGGAVVETLANNYNAGRAGAEQKAATALPVRVQ
jgi:hypothetical protein